MNEKNQKKLFLESAKGIFLLAVTATFLWGSAYPCVKTGYLLFNIPVEDTGGKLLFAGLRFFLAGVFTLIAVVVIQKKIVMPKKTDMPWIALLGIVQTSIQYLFFYIGLSNTTGVKGAILVGTGTFIAVILSHFFYKDDKLNLIKIFGCIIGFIGIVFINTSGVGGGSFSLKGEGFLLIAAIAFAVGSLISKEAAKNSDPMMITGYQLFFGGGVLIAAGIINGGKLSYVSANGILILLYLAFLSAAAFTLWTMLLKHNKVGRIAIYNCLVPVFGTILSAVFLKEEFLVFQSSVALLCVCMGIYLVNKEV